eukprot:GFKZ01009157.1.p1 GENE.GFKZ01009157.1~~GFKZ01009157.1.p1  ORF type:complete len:103 (-),score=6.65 GFKZ01009157.1:205-513(-)
MLKFRSDKGWLSWKIAFDAKRATKGRLRQGLPHSGRDILNLPPRSSHLSSISRVFRGSEKFKHLRSRKLQSTKVDRPVFAPRLDTALFKWVLRVSRSTLVSH